MNPRGRTIRLEISLEFYDALEAHALERDVGIADVLRHVVIEWLDDNPAPVLAASA